jgi:hypothetical protein
MTDVSAASLDPSVQQRIDDDFHREYADLLRASIVNWRKELAAVEFRIRAKDRLLRIAEQKHARAGRIRGAVDTEGRALDFNTAAVNTLKRELGQLWYEQELLDVQIDEAMKDLAALPVPAEESGG